MLAHKIEKSKGLAREIVDLENRIERAKNGSPVIKSGGKKIMTSSNYALFYAVSDDEAKITADAMNILAIEAMEKRLSKLRYRLNEIFLGDDLSDAKKEDE